MNKIDSVTHIFFDLDGTLYNCNKLRLYILFKFFIQIFNLFNIFNFIRDFKLIFYYRRELENLRFYEFRNKQNVFDFHIERISFKLNIKKEIVLKIINLWFNQVPLKYLPKCMPNNVETTLSELKKRGYKLGIFSDYLAIDKLISMRILPYFDSVVSSQDSDSNGYKPNNNGIKRLITKTHSEAYQCCYVGDRIDCDVLTSQINNVLPVLLSNKHAHTINNQVPYIKITSLQELLTIFK